MRSGVSALVKAGRGGAWRTAAAAAGRRAQSSVSKTGAVQEVPAAAVGPFGSRSAGIFDMTEPADKQLISIRGYGDTSFQVNEVQVNQSVLLFRKSFLLWNARTFEDITVDSLALFSLLHPTIEVLFIGCGELQPSRLPADLVQHFKAKGIVLEASTSVNAAATFNILISEGRNVAAALLTNKPVDEQT